MKMALLVKMLIAGLQLGFSGREEDGVNLVICKPHLDAVVEVRRQRGDQCVPPRTETKRLMRAIIA